MGVVVLAAISVVVMLLWNFLIPSIFGLTTISFWQALGLFVLARILFGGFKPGRGRMWGHGGENPIHKKWRNMTPEQRKEFVNKRRKFGFGHPFGRDSFDMEGNEEQRKEDE